MKIIIFEFLGLIKYFLFIISILGILVQAHRKNLVQAIVHCTTMYIYYSVHCSALQCMYIQDYDEMSGNVAENT